MTKLIRFVVGIVMPAFIVAGGIANSAVAQDKAAKGMMSSTVILDNAKVRVLLNTFKPGDVNTNILSSSPRVVRALKGGTLERTYADGKKESIVWKSGDVRYLESSPVTYTNKNVGKTEIQLYLVVLK